MTLPPILVVELGRRGYGEVLALQRDLAARRAAEELPDLLLLVEHEPTITLGRGTRAESLPFSRTEVEQRGVEWYEVERGGDVTYHGPGQLVGYPILSLTAHRPDLHWYLRQLEQALIDALGDLGVAGERRAGLTGVWTQGRKIASLGVHVRRWATFHGFALNVSGPLDGFGLIVPCGIPGVTMTSVERELNGAVPRDPPLWETTQAAVIRHFARVFQRDACDVTLQALEPARA